MRKRLALMAGVTALLVAVLAGGAQPVAAKSAKPAAAIRTLARQTHALPHAIGSRAQHRKLNRAARRSRRAFRKHPCAAVRSLARYRKVLRNVRAKRGRRFRRANRKLSRLGPASLEASRRLLATKRTRRCGGGVKPNRRKRPVTKILSSNANGMHLQVKLPAVQFVQRTGAGQNWTQLFMPNTDSPGTPGTPGIPVISSAFGMPDGSTLSVHTGKKTFYKLDSVDVFPAQPDPVDADTQPPNFFAGPFDDEPFERNRKAYASDSLFPPKPAQGQVLGDSRDLHVGGLQIPAAQYNPADRTLKVLTSVDVTLTFNGGPHTFSPELGSSWEHSQQLLLESMLNASFLKTLKRADFLRRCGEEMLVITNPATLTAANQFATARRAAGLRVSVFQTGTAAGQIGTIPGEIQTFIRSRLTRFLCIHPSYVTILGDDDLVPTFPGINGIPSDLQYSMRDDTDELPDVAVGRIIGNDQAAIQTAVNKIVGYETAPPSGAWLRHATIAAQFQDDDADGKENRTFVQFAETARKGLAGLGMTIDRVYRDSPTTTPQKLNDGTDLPAALLKPTFPWTGSGADVTAAWNDGRFLMVHRDHGYSDGWGTPGFGTADVQALTNGAKLPVLLSINCSSGAYDYDETSFVGESLVNPNGGAVGAFGDTRDSPTWHNTQIALGFLDGLLPRVLPSEGPADKQRTGQALINGKLRLAGLAPPGGDGNTRNELYLWHYFGDPSMQMWGGNPIRIDPSLINAVYTTQLVVDSGDPPPYGVHVTMPAELSGQTISLLRNGQVIGKAFVNGDGTADIPAGFGDGTPDASELQVAMEPDGGAPVIAPVKGTPQNTRLTQSCPAEPVASPGVVTTTGTLSPAFAGANITVTYTRPDATTFTHTVQTNANGEWTDTMDPNAEYDPNFGAGTWHVRSRFAGDAGHRGSSTSDCQFEVFNHS